MIIYLKPHAQVGMYVDKVIPCIDYYKYTCFIYRCHPPLRCDDFSDGQRSAALDLAFRGLQIGTGQVGSSKPMVATCMSYYFNPQVF